MPGEFSPYLVATPLVTLMFAFYGRVMPFGALGYVGGALAGFVWSLVAGVVSSWLSQDATIAALSADAVLFACVIVAGSLVGGGVLYLLLFWSVLREPSTTYAVLSALMRPTVPFFIALNSAMEVLFVPLVVFLNWNTEARRRWIIVIAAGIYVVHRGWTYLVYAERRLATGTSPLSEADVGWYTRTLATDYRVVLNAIIFALFTAAAFLNSAPH
jgi:hypothetical protein